MSKLPHFIHNTNIGQNFLRDHSVIDFIIERAALTEKDQVLEIGPGEGISSGISARRPCKYKVFARFLLREKVWRREIETKGAAW